MNKCLNFHIIRNMFSDFSDLRKGKFPGCYYTFRTQIIPETIGFIVCIICLCTDMSLNLRTDFLCIHIDSRISNDQGIRFQFFQLCQIFSDSRQIIIMSQNIYSYINLYSMFMGKDNSLFHIIMGKILGFSSQSKGFSTDIYSICSENNSNL